MTKLRAKELTASEALEQYSKLWQIEDCFRVAKHDLRIRPIFHWTPQRVRAHLLIRFLALVCLRSPACRGWLRSRISEDARKLYTTLALKPVTAPFEIPQN